jgi:hypothetical protein
MQWSEKTVEIPHFSKLRYFLNRSQVDVYRGLSRDVINTYFVLQVGALEPEAITVSSTSHTQSTYLALRAS